MDRDTGVLVGHKDGDMTVIVTSDNVHAVFPIKIVGDAGLFEIRVSSGADTVISGSLSPAFSASGFDKYGNPVLPDPAFVWTAGIDGEVGTAEID